MLDGRLDVRWSILHIRFYNLYIKYYTIDVTLYILGSIYIYIRYDIIYIRDVIHYICVIRCQMWYIRYFILYIICYMLCISYHRSLISDIRWHVPLCRQGLVHLGIVCVWYHVLYHICVYDYISHIYIYILYITHDIIRHRASALLVWPVPPSGCVLASGPPASSRPSLQLWDCFKGTPPIPTFKCSNSYIYIVSMYIYIYR